MKNFKCDICNSKSLEVVWNNKIRNSSKNFTKNKKKIIKCNNCDVLFLEKKLSYLEDSSISRNIYLKNNSVKEFYKFHKNREKKKLSFFNRNIKFKNKKILESNCGAGIILDILKKKSKITAGLDSKIYRSHLISKNHLHYSNFNEIKKSKIKFDVIFSLSELEHKFNPIQFLKNIIQLLAKNGLILLRVPNYFNIYMFMLGDMYKKFDFRTSHNYYFSIKNLKILFKKLNLKIIKYKGMNEYDINHLIEYLKTNKRVNSKKRINKIFSQKKSMEINKNIDNSLVSTSLLFILQKK